MTEFTKKTVDISQQCIHAMQHAEFEYRIMYTRLDSGTKYRAVLRVWDEYDGYLVQWKVCERSTLFDSAEEAEQYAIEKWLDKES